MRAVHQIDSACNKLIACDEKGRRWCWIFSHLVLKQFSQFKCYSDFMKMQKMVTNDDEKYLLHLSMNCESWFALISFNSYLDSSTWKFELISNGIEGGQFNWVVQFNGMHHFTFLQQATWKAFYIYWKFKGLADNVSKCRFDAFCFNLSAT